jgi:hypothetical protein
MDWLGTAANVASILTMLGGAVGVVLYRYGFHRREKKLEDYLLDISKNPQWPTDPGERTVDQLISELG